MKKKLAFGCSGKYFTRKWPCEGFSLSLEPDSSEIVLLVKIALGSHQRVLVSNPAVRHFLEHGLFLETFMVMYKPLNWFTNFYIINISLKKDDWEPYISWISGSLAKHFTYIHSHMRGSFHNWFAKGCWPDLKPSQIAKILSSAFKGLFIWP